MTDKRRKDANWIVTNADGSITAWEQICVAVLMDIRDELKQMNRLLNCPNFISIPHKLDAIRRNTTKPKRRKP